MVSNESTVISEIFGKIFSRIAKRDNCQVLFVFVCFVALRPKSTATVMAGRSVHLTTLFPGQA